MPTTNQLSRAESAKLLAKRKGGASPASVAVSESASQQHVFRWWATVHRQWAVPERLMFAVPLQAARTARNGARMKAEGARAGVPDILALIPRGTFAGLAIEMKRAKQGAKPGGKLSDAQREFLNDLTAQGYFTAVCYSADEAIRAISEYLNLPVK